MDRLIADTDRCLTELERVGEALERFDRRASTGRSLRNGYVLADRPVPVPVLNELPPT